MQSAQDFDTYTSSSRDGIQTKSYAADGPLTYRWSASAGHFKDDTETGQNVTWVAPDDLSEATSVIIKCIIDDPDGPRVSAPDTGSHDDNATVRMATVIVKPPTVEFTGEELVSGTVRACAGGVDDHAATDPNPNWVERNDAQYRAHTRQVELTAKFDGKPLPNARFSLRFADNKGHDYGDGREKKMARLHKADESFAQDSGWTETLDLQSDEAGKVSVWMLSSDVINKPKLQAILKPVAAPLEPMKLGEIECDFAPPESVRRFGVKDYVNIVDDGWIFNPGLLIPSEEEDNSLAQSKTISAKVYLKFQNDQSVDKDNAYFWIYPNDGGPLIGSKTPSSTLDADNDGIISSEERESGEVRRPLDDDGNWRVINQHKIRVRIALVINSDNIAGSEEDTAKYCTILDENGNPTSFVDVKTSSDGAALLKIRGGSMIELAKSIHLEAKDLSIFPE